MYATIPDSIYLDPIINLVKYGIRMDPHVILLALGISWARCSLLIE